MAASPTGGAYVLWANGNKLYLRHIDPSGTVTNCTVISGTIGALCVGPDGTVHMAYNAGGKMWYKTWRPY